MENDTKSLVDSALEDIALKAIKSVIVRESGWGIETEIKELIKEKARKILEESPELQAMIRERIIFWVKQQ